MDVQPNLPFSSEDYFRIIQSHPDLDWITWSKEQIEKRIQNSQVFTVRRLGQTVGFLLGISDYVSNFIITLVAVHKDWERQGIATELLQQVDRFIKENYNIKGLTISVHAEGEAKDLYRKAGFLETIKDWDATLMHKYNSETGFETDYRKVK